MNRFVTGLVVGKFAPLHLGHELVIRRALAECDRVVVLSYSRPELPGCDPARRAAWLAARFPEAIRIVLAAPRESPPDNHAPDEAHRAFCAEVVRRHTGLRIDAIFSSEDYGPGFAADLARRQGAPVTHVAVDVARAQMPVSGTALRGNPHELRHFLSAEVYASFVERLVLVGGESSGKSTLATALARALGTSQVAEYGRELWDRRAGRLTLPDLTAIAGEQVRREECAMLSPRTNRYVVCDTSPLTTLFYSLDMFGEAGAELQSLSQRPYHHTFLCAADFPFVQDGTRRDTAYRDRQQAWYREKLSTLNHQVVHGPLEARVAQVLGVLGATPTAYTNPVSL